MQLLWHGKKSLAPLQPLTATRRRPLRPAPTARPLQQHGFRVLVPDLYKGKIGVDAEEASHVSELLSHSRIFLAVSVASCCLQRHGTESLTEAPQPVKKSPAQHADTRETMRPRPNSS